MAIPRRPNPIPLFRRTQCMNSVQRSSTISPIGVTKTPAGAGVRPLVRKVEPGLEVRLRGLQSILVRRYEWTLALRRPLLDAQHPSLSRPHDDFGDGVLEDTVRAEIE